MQSSNIFPIQKYEGPSAVELAQKNQARKMAEQEAVANQDIPPPVSGLTQQQLDFVSQVPTTHSNDNNDLRILGRK